MRRCSGNNTQEWGFEAIFEMECPGCGFVIEFYKDEIKKVCKICGETVPNNRKDQGCGQWCSSKSEHTRNLCSKYRRSKMRWRKW